jgi:multidrug resistance efflux pump
MKDTYLDKKDRLKVPLTPAKATIVAIVVLITVFAPVWPAFVEAGFVLEPAHRAVIRAEVPGIVTQVLATENESVSAGTPLIELENLSLQSEAAETRAALSVASARAVSAALRYADFGRAERERQASAARDQSLAERMAHLELSSPIRGVVVTPRLKDLQGRYVEAGTKVAEVADLSTMVARIYVPEFGMRDVRTGTSVKLRVSSRIVPISGILSSLSPVSSEIDPALTEKAQLSGIVPPPYYVGLVYLANNGRLLDGMTGTAKVYVRRRSVAEMLARFTRDLLERRFW